MVDTVADSNTLTNLAFFRPKVGNPETVQRHLTEFLGARLWVDPMIGVWTERLLGFSYPLVVHLCILAGEISLAVYWLAGLLALLAARKFVRQRGFGWWIVGLAGCALILVWSAGAAPESAIYFPPVVINLALLAMFARTLLPGHTPLITRLAMLIDPDLSETGLGYTRSITWVWTVYFLVMATIAVALAVVAPIEIWSLFANFLHYLLVPLLFIIEFQVRRKVLGDEADDRFAIFLRRLLGVMR